MDRWPYAPLQKDWKRSIFPEDPLPLYINKKSESLRVIQQLRDEAHRFAITFHRQQRSRKSIRADWMVFRA